MSTGLAVAALAARECRLVVVGGCGVTGGLVGDMAEVLASLCAGLCGRRLARDRALEALGCAGQGIGPRAVEFRVFGGAG